MTGTSQTQSEALPSYTWFGCQMIFMPPTSQRAILVNVGTPKNIDVLTLDEAGQVRDQRTLRVTRRHKIVLT